MFASAFTYMFIIYIYMFTIHLLFFVISFAKVWTVYTSYMICEYCSFRVEGVPKTRTLKHASLCQFHGGWMRERVWRYMKIWMFPKIVGFPPKSSILTKVFHYFHHPFWGPTPIFGNTHIGPSIETLHLLCMEKLKAEMVAMTEHVFHRWCSQFEAPIRHGETSDDMDQQINLRYSPMWIYQPFKRFFVLNTHIMFKGFLQNSQLNWYPLV